MQAATMEIQVQGVGEAGEQRGTEKMLQTVLFTKEKHRLIVCNAQVQIEREKYSTCAKPHIIDEIH